MKTRYYDGDTFERRGYTFRVNFRDDDTIREPWKEYDGHGVVSEWRSKDSKRPGEKILIEDRGRCLFYDVQATTKIAKKDQWGCKHSKIEGGVFISGHETKGEALACAVESDYDRLRRFCSGDWQYIGVVVTMIEFDDDDDEADTDERESVWGIESDSADYLTETAHELADEILSRVEVDNPDIQVSEN
jgi:hypothetical protein